uniref:peptidyl-tRNA hydrolase n=1 Tax=Equus caballus TaxID=9796 RepID=F6S0H6_HORSE
VCIIPTPYYREEKTAASGTELQFLVQYLMLRKNLSQAPFSWQVDTLVAQACHAATAHSCLPRQEPEHVLKVILETPEEMALKELAETLQQNIDHMLWLEQRENITTCIALRPYSKGEVTQYVEKFQLFK